MNQLTDPNSLQNFQNSSDDSAPSYYVVKCTEEADLTSKTECVNLANKELLVEYLKKLSVEKPASQMMQVFIFYGTRLFLSKGPYQFLLDGLSTTPLFVISQKIEPDLDGIICD